MLERGIAYFARIAGRQVDVFQPALLMPEIAFVLQQAQHGPYRGIAWRVGQIGADLRDRGLAATIDHIHNLAFAPAQLQVFLVGHNPPWHPCANALAYANTLAHDVKRKMDHGTKELSRELTPRLVDRRF